MGVSLSSAQVCWGGCGLWSLRTGYTVGLELGVYGLGPGGTVTFQTVKLRGKARLNRLVSG